MGQGWQWWWTSLAWFMNQRGMSEKKWWRFMRKIVHSDWSINCHPTTCFCWLFPWSSLKALNSLEHFWAIQIMTFKLPQRGLLFSPSQNSYLQFRVSYVGFVSPCCAGDSVAPRFVSCARRLAMRLGCHSKTWQAKKNRNFHYRNIYETSYPISSMYGICIPTFSCFL